MKQKQNNIKTLIINVLNKNLLHHNEGYLCACQAILFLFLTNAGTTY